MENSPATPETIWVISNITNSGKTTLAKATLEVLTRYGHPSIGFKPYAAGSMLSLHDFALENYPKTSAKFYGYDSLALTAGSRICSIEDAEVVQPVAFVTYPEFVETFLIRIGSPEIGGRKILVGKAYEVLSKRKDFRTFIEKAGMEEVLAAPSVDLRFESAPNIGVSEVEASYQLLNSKYQPKFAVIEGASGFLPLWKTGQLINHILLIQNHRIYFFPNINYVTNGVVDRLVSFKELQRTFNTPNNIQIEYPFAIAADRAAVAYKYMEQVLRKAKIIN